MRATEVAAVEDALFAAIEAKLEVRVQSLLEAIMALEDALNAQDVDAAGFVQSAELALAANKAATSIAWAARALKRLGSADAPRIEHDALELAAFETPGLKERS